MNTNPLSAFPGERSVNYYHSVLDKAHSNLLVGHATERHPTLYQVSTWDTCIYTLDDSRLHTNSGAFIFYVGPYWIRPIQWQRLNNVTSCPYQWLRADIHSQVTCVMINYSNLGHFLWPSSALFRIQSARRLSLPAAPATCGHWRHRRRWVSGSRYLERQWCSLVWRLIDNEKWKGESVRAGGDDSDDGMMGVRASRHCRFTLNSVLWSCSPT